MATSTDNPSPARLLACFVLTFAVACAPVIAAMTADESMICIHTMTDCPPDHCRSHDKKADACCGSTSAASDHGCDADADPGESNCGDCGCCVTFAHVAVWSMLVVTDAGALTPPVDVVRPLASLQPTSRADDVQLRPPIC